MKKNNGHKPTLIHGRNSRRAADWHKLIKATYVCFDCRISKKECRSFGYINGEAPKCQHCGGPMTDLGTTWRIPARSQVRAWKRMQDVVMWTKKGRAILRRDRSPGCQMKRPSGVRRQRLF